MKLAGVARQYEVNIIHHLSLAMQKQRANLIKQAAKQVKSCGALLVLTISLQHVDEEVMSRHSKTLPQCV